MSYDWQNEMNSATKNRNNNIDVFLNSKQSYESFPKQANEMLI